MYPYGYYPEYLPVQPETYVPYDYSYIEQPDIYDIDRQPPQSQNLERRIRQLERQNEDQTRELLDKIEKSIESTKKSPVSIKMMNAILAA